jgi:hypothetical protein
MLADLFDRLDGGADLSVGAGSLSA